MVGGFIFGLDHFNEFNKQSVNLFDMCALMHHMRIVYSSAVQPTARGPHTADLQTRLLFSQGQSSFTGDCHRSKPKYRRRRSDGAVRIKCAENSAL